MITDPQRSRGRVLLAWAVHLYTASGLVVAGLVAALLVRGRPEDFRWVFLLLVVSVVVDASDGTMARKVGVKRVLPGFDGRRLDDITDFHTYTSLPLFLIWRSGVLPASWAPLLFLPLLASAYGFSQADAKTDDGYFQGFPSYWNVVALYLHYLRPPAPFALAVLLLLAVLTFVPAKYLYPSQPGLLNRITAVGAALWSAVLVLVLLDVVHPARPWLIASLAFPAFYMLASWWITIRDLRARAGT